MPYYEECFITGQFDFMAFILVVLLTICVGLGCVIVALRS